MSDEMLKKVLDKEDAIILSLENEKIWSVLFGYNLEIDEHFYRVVAENYITLYKHDIYAYIEKLLSKNNSTTEKMKEFLQFFDKGQFAANSCFVLNWAGRYKLTETLSARDVLNDYFEYKLNFKGKNAKSVKEFLAKRATNEGFEYLPKCLLKPGYRPQDDLEIRADLKRCAPRRGNIRSHLERMAYSYEN